MKNLIVRIEQWQALKQALLPSVAFRKTTFKILMKSIESEQKKPWWKVWK